MAERLRASGVRRDGWARRLGAEWLRAAMLAAALMVIAWVGMAMAQAGSSGQTAQSGQVQGAGSVAGSAQAKQQPTIAEKIAASKELLDINTATVAQLKALPGMGNAYVARVVAGRPYTAKNQLVTRGVLPEAEYERIRELVIAHRVKQ